jgi:1-acyl-sn-glycerol-3-phosphate acyltransferase
MDDVRGVAGRVAGFVVHRSSFIARRSSLVVHPSAFLSFRPRLYSPPVRRFSGLAFPVYRAGWLAGRLIFSWTTDVRVLRPSAADRTGGYVLACTHFSHLDPFCLSVILRRPVDWMARIEFYRRAPLAAAMGAVGAFPVNRQGVPVSAIRTAVARVRAGRVVGVFPEGGVCRGAESACRGGGFKNGACLIACRAGVPILPCVILGSHTLNRVGPWVPLSRTPLWVALGEPIPPRFARGPRAARRAARDEMARELGRQFVGLFHELKRTYGIRDAELV